MPGSATVAASAGNDAVLLRRADQNERFVAFAFAGADLLCETDADGRITYAGGAFRSRFGQPAEAFIGRRLRELIAPADHEALDAAVALLTERGRLLPLLVRVADAERTPLALAGMVLPAVGRPVRLCFSLARPPAPLAAGFERGTPHRLARAVEARRRGTGGVGDLGLLDIVDDRGAAVADGETIGHLLESLAPEAIATEVAPGRFGVLGPAGSKADILAVAALLEGALREQGLGFAVAARQVPLDDDGMSPVQAARALRQALNVFARDGIAALDGQGFAGGLAGYLRRAGDQASRLRQAIRDNQFSLSFQPVVALTDRAPHHYEALIRPRPIRDCPIANPQEFVMLIEAAGLADALDLAVARAACDAAAAAGRSVAFNVSGQSMQCAEFRDQLMALLEPHPARAAGLLLLEMTETAELEDFAEAARTADALRGVGIPFCLDDFGAGAADIRAFRAMKPDIVKLDGSYVPGVAAAGRDRALVAGMVEMARSGGARIVAERVETEAEAAALTALGVEYGQGWLFGRPGPLPAPAGAGGGRARRKGETESWG